MSPVVKNIIGLFAGLVIGSIVNGLIIANSGKIIPLPVGVDATTVEGLKAGMHLMEPRHFIMPFLAHALGTLTGAIVAAKMVATNKKTYAIVIGFMFLIGGIINVAMLPAPMWFNVLDLLLAYIPMGWLGWKMTNKKA